MRPRLRAGWTIVLGLSLTMFLTQSLATGAASGSGEYAKHFDALSKLSVSVAEAMPADQYGFKPHPESMDFGELMAHIATTNYQFCAGLKDAQVPAMPSPHDKDGYVKFLSDSFTYCSGVISNMTDAQMSAAHDSPDGRMPGKEVLLAMYVHVAHHRGQAEIYLRDTGIKPPVSGLEKVSSFRFQVSSDPSRFRVNPYAEDAVVRSPLW
jgi:uncharacterized damage-inducible protein DinB